MWKRCAATSRLTQAACGPACIARQHLGSVGAFAEGACGILARTSRFNVDVEERESTDIAAAIATGAADLGFAAEHALPENFERFLFSEDRLMLVAARHGEFAGRRQIDFQEVSSCDFVGLTNSTALQVHIAKHAARLGMRLRFRAR